MRKVTPVLAAILLGAAASAPAATVLYCPLDSFEGWSVRTVGASNAAIVDRGDDARCVELTSHRGSVFLSRELPLQSVRGSQVTVTCSVKSERIVRGPQASSTGKVHLAVQTPGGIAHHYARFVGTEDWHQEAFTADVPRDARRVLLNLGLESCFGRAMFNRLIVRNDQRGVHPLDLSATVNAGHEQLGLAAFPKETVHWEGVPLQIVDAARHHGLDCFRLKGIEHPDWPASTSAPIPLGTAASAIYILQGALGGRETSESPGAIWTATFLGGQTTGLSVFEGREIGAVGRSEDLENWYVAWRETDADGNEVTFGVTRWTIYGDAPIESISCRAYRGASPVVLAITVVEEPPQPEEESLDDGSGFQ